MASSIVRYLKHHHQTNKEFMISLMIFVPIQLVFGILSFIFVDDFGEPVIWNWATKLIPVACDIVSASILVIKEPRNKLRVFVLVALALSLAGILIRT
jgi:hypothetical protein